MNKYKSLLSNTLLVFGGNIGSKLITLFMMPMYTRWLSVEGYGLTDLLTIYVTLLFSIVSFCIPDALFIFPCGVSRNEQKKYFSSGLSFNALSIFFTFFLFLTLDIISGLYNWHNSFVDNIWFIYIMLITQIFQQQCQQYSRSLNRMTIYSLTGLIYTISFALYSIMFIRAFGVSGYVISISLANITSAFYCFFSVKGSQYICLTSVSRNAIKEMLAYSMPLIPNSIMWWLVNALNRPIMEASLGMHDIGIYAVANRFPGLITMVFSVFATSWQMSVIDEFKKDGFEHFYNNVLKAVFLIIILVLICLTFSSKLIVQLFADSNFYESWKYIPLLSFGTFLSCLSTFTGVVFSAARKSKYYLYSSVWGAVVSLLFNYLLIPRYGLWGTCISVVLSFVAIVLARVYYSRDYVSIKNECSYILVIIFLLVMICMFTINLVLISVILAFVALLYVILMNKDSFYILHQIIINRIAK